MKGITVIEAKRYGIYSCREDATLQEVSRYMLDEDVSCLVVVGQDDYLAGVITHTDLVRAAMEDKAWTGRFVRDFMTRPVVTVTPATTLEEVALLLLEHKIHRVVVVSHEEDGDRPVAVVASSDLVYHMVEA